jgi:hypothetical protein
MKNNERMNSSRKTAIIVGGLFLIAMVASLLGGSLIESVITAPDYLVAVSENQAMVVIGVLLELINAISVLGIGVLMFPVLRPHNENMALGYLGFRIVESVFCSVIVISPLSLIRLSHQFLGAGASEASLLQTIGALSIAGRASVAGLLIPLFLSLGGLLFYSLLYQYKLLPRFIPAWGFIAAVLILTMNLLLTFNIELSIAINLIFALPIITNEIFLGIWLIVKGFNPSEVAPSSAK